MGLGHPARPRHLCHLALPRPRRQAPHRPVTPERRVPRAGGLRRRGARRHRRRWLGPGRHHVVAVGRSLGFLIALGSQGIEWTIVAALLIGGVIAAPFAAWLVKLLPARILAIAAGGIIILTNARTILLTLGTQPTVVWTVLGAS